MTLCSDGHDEVCYDGRDCPVCEYIKEKDDEMSKLEMTILNQETDIEKLNDEVERLTEKIKWQDLSDYLKEGDDSCQPQI